MDRCDPHRYGLTAVAGLHDLKLDDGFWYLGSPFRSYYAGQHAAYLYVSDIETALQEEGVNVFSPIVFCNRLCDQLGIAPDDNDFWTAAFKPFTAKAHGLIVAGMEGWEVSNGLREEINIFKSAGKPTLFLDPTILFPTE